MIGPRAVSRSSPETTKLTVEDYLQTADDESYERFDGALITMPAPSIAHQHVAMKLGTRLDSYVEEAKLGVVFSAPTDVVLTQTDVVQPDLIFISSERPHIVTTANIQNAPDLIVEIISDSTAERDETLKRQLYGECGVQEYWLVDPEARIIAVMLLGEDGYAETATHTDGQTLTSPMLEGFAAHLDEILLSLP